MATRRERARLATVAEIKAAALQQVASLGAPELTIRGVARAIGMSPAGIYRYYDSRDALLTDLLTDAYTDLADAVSAAAGWGPAGGVDAPSDPLAALLAATVAYRDWALAQPARFLLIFGTPVPGYQAPPQGPTVTANQRMGAVFFGLGALAWAAGQVAPASGHRTAAEPTTEGQQDVLAQLRDLAPDLPDDFVTRMLGGWALVHGLVTLEVTGQLHWALSDPGASFTGHMQAWIEAFRQGAV
jgi:AcrR family transcriptional regulator